ncbi:DNA gyrase subunit A [Mycoplasma sp. P36-A1]|uniref:DNA gyrase subunit A n=1 Tax=Mycoplasma sp. P36-A1 TaxID=3252900 RepID=UPI003C2D7E05
MEENKNNENVDEQLETQTDESVEKEKEYDKVIGINISNEMRTSFLDYAMSVIVARALPDVRDGLKPVHRRIIFAMNAIGLYADKQYRKSATVVGEVLGKYHPHGDSSVYDAMVRMAQDFSFRYPLVNGHGNFGSIDGDEAAAMRYTEAKMSKIAMALVENINEDTVDFVDNFDAREKEPSVMPSRYPNLLANGASGIAVGMATNIPPHNLGELIDAIKALMDDPEITTNELHEKYIFGPDFPTGALILGKSGIRKAFETGRGPIIMRSVTDIEEMKNGKKRIVVTEIPYQVNKASLVEKIADLAREKRIEGITDLRDESNRNGIRIVIELRKDVNAEVLLNQLYKLTSLQASFNVNALSLVNGKPELLGLKPMLKLYLDHQIEVIVRRTKFRLKKAADRAHILEGLKIALDNIDRVISIIRGSANDAEATSQLSAEFGLSEAQTKAILDMRLARLTGLAREKLELELTELHKTMAYLQDILDNHYRVLEIIGEELEEIRNKFADKRRSEIIAGSFDLEDEDLIPQEDIIITMTTNGYIKRLPEDTYRIQNRGGRGIKGMSTNEGDDVDQIITLSTHDFLFAFSNKGKVYRIKGYQVPEFTRTAKGLPIVNLLQLDEDESILTLMSVKDSEEDRYMFLATKNGTVKRTKLSEFDSIRQSGKIAISLKEDDELFGVKLTDGKAEIYIGSTNGKLVRFDEDQIRIMGRTAAGVRGINLEGDNKVVGLATSLEGNKILVMSENGYGKLSDVEEYRKSNRGAKGVKTLNITEKNGNLIDLRAVYGNEDAIISTSSGIVIRVSLEQVNTIGRNSIGVRIIKVDEGHTVSTVSIVQASPEVEEDSENLEETKEIV